MSHCVDIQRLSVLLKHFLSNTFILFLYIDFSIYSSESYNTDVTMMFSIIMTWHKLSDSSFSYRYRKSHHLCHPPLLALHLPLHPPLLNETLECRYLNCLRTSIASFFSLTFSRLFHFEDLQFTTIFLITFIFNLWSLLTMFSPITKLFTFP